MTLSADSPSNTQSSRPAPDLATPLKHMKGVGPDRAALLSRLGLHYAQDVLFHFPRDYEDTSQLANIDQLVEGQPVSVRGVVAEIELRNTSPGRSILGVLIRQGSHELRAIWFNQPYQRDRFFIGQQILVSGSPKRQGFGWDMPHPRVQPVEEGDPVGEILPIYPLTEGLTQSQMRRVASAVVEEFASLVPEVLPDTFRQPRQLCDIATAISEMHRPSSTASLAAARERLAYQELLALQLALALRRLHIEHHCQARPIEVTARIDARIRRLLPFEFTPGQEQAVQQISQDMGRAFPMNRLLQGDVGSGKTLVAVYAMLAAVACGQQAVLMAPTEILARQHRETLAKMLSESRTRLGLLTGGLGTKERRQLVADVEAGDVDIVIGTQAIVKSQLQFAQLGLAVIDEQHKFGVKERAQLRQSGMDPHVLVMTATPIPRTIALGMFGDLDVTSITDKPPGRQPVHTYLTPESERDKWWEFMARKLREGRQGYVIAPQVGDADLESEHLESAEQVYAHLANGPLEAFRLGLLHGRMSAAEKTAAMESFHQGDWQVLVATSLVEVGIDVPNATIMTIESANKFGLAQLHQLRGRVSRGTRPGFVSAFAAGASEEAIRRLQAFADTDDGFRLAELDLELRGPGELAGTRQSGLPPLRIADLGKDQELLKKARQDARELVRDMATWLSESFAPLRRQVRVRYGDKLELGDVG